MMWLLIILVSLAFITVIVFLIQSNFKEDKRFKAELKNIYPDNNAQEGG
ncbi:hypothetical protein [Ferruginibacter sp.]